MNDLTRVVFSAILIYLITATEPWYAETWWFFTSMIVTAFLSFILFDGIARILMGA